MDRRARDECFWTNGNYTSYVNTRVEKDCCSDKDEKITRIRIKSFEYSWAHVVKF